MVVLVMVLAVVYLTQFRINAPSGGPEAVQSFRNDLHEGGAPCQWRRRPGDGRCDRGEDQRPLRLHGPSAIAEQRAAEEIAPDRRGSGSGQPSDKTVQLLSRMPKAVRRSRRIRHLRTSAPQRRV